MKLFLTILFLFVLYKQTTGIIRVHIYVTTPMTCTEAQKYCQTYHTDLSTINGEVDIQMVQNAAGGVYNQSWFSSLIQKTENSCTLMNYEEARIPAFWTALCGFPNWLCTSMHPFFCSKNLVLVQKKKTWEEALEYCRSNYIDLAYLDSKVIPDLSDAQTESVWTGMRFLAGKWFWVSKENILETNINLPSCPHEPYRCGACNTQKEQWENRDCEEKLSFLCF
ncbi:hypothetical protein ABG768_000696 [Culter alburnus]|uniref:C-type lectin domain-containing protein n=1 Tax=Culter alburnus TaxID=194366 RepID=A0AAW2B791_CULAL